MHTIDLAMAQKIAASIKDDGNLAAQSAAIAKRDQWILEADTGTLQLSDELREILEQA